MGSGTKRKKNDTVVIKTPRVSILGGGISSFRYSSSDLIAEVCLPSFDVKLEPSSYTKEKLKVYLSVEGVNYIVTVGNVTIGKLSKKQSSMVSKCKEFGVKYNGAIIKNGGEFYARFFRTL